MYKQKHKIVSIDSLIPNTWNPNEQTSFMQEKTKLSIHNHDAIEPLIVRTIGKKEYQIIDGYHRWLAMRELGYKEIGVIDLGVISEEIAKGMTMTMNELKGVVNEIKLSKILNELEQVSNFDQLLEEMPYDKKDLENLLKKTANGWDELKPDEPFTGFNLKDDDSGVNLKSYVIVLPKEKFDILQVTIKKVMQETESSEGRAVELMCADVLAGL